MFDHKYLTRNKNDDDMISCINKNGQCQRKAGGSLKTGNLKG